MYEKEHSKEKERVQKMKADGADASDIKQAVRVLLLGSLGIGRRSQPGRFDVSKTSWQHRLHLSVISSRLS